MSKSERPFVKWPQYALFEGDSRPAVQDALVLIAAAREVLEGDDAERTVDEAWRFMDGSARGAYELYKRGALPLEVVEVAAGVTAIVRPKDYGTHPIWDVGVELAAPHAGQISVELEDGIRGIARFEAELHGDNPEDVIGYWRERVAKFLRAKTTLASGGPARANAPSAEEVAAGARIAVIGAGGQRREDIEEARPVVYRNRALGPAWEGLCCAFDVAGGGSFAGLDRLGAIADARAESPALLWLDECACRGAGERERAARRARALDALLASGPFGKNAAKVVMGVQIGRERVEADLTAIQDGWLLLAASLRRAAPSPQSGEAILRASLRAAAADGIAGISRLQRFFTEIEEIIRLEPEELGPFCSSPDVSDEVMRRIDAFVHYTLLGFRELYGLEILRGALPRLEKAIADRKLLGSLN